MSISLLAAKWLVIPNHSKSAYALAVAEVMEAVLRLLPRTPAPDQTPVLARVPALASGLEAAPA